MRVSNTIFTIGSPAGAHVVMSFFCANIGCRAVVSFQVVGLAPGHQGVVLPSGAGLPPGFGLR